MIVFTECTDLAARIPPYLENTLPSEEHTAVNEHLRGCPKCRKEAASFKKLQSFAQATLSPVALSPEFNTKTGEGLKVIATEAQLGVPAREAVPVGFSSSIQMRFGSAPWWAVSACLHVLAVLLASLVTMTIGQVLEQDEIIIVTNIEKSLPLQAEEDKKVKSTLRDVLDSNVDVPPTDPLSPDQSNIVVPPDILAKAEVGDHFETINLDRPDTQSAFGNPEARMFHSVQGNDEPEGGGGAGGAGLMDALIGMGSAVSPGSGDGWGGGNGNGTGIGNGSGHGSFGNRDGGGRRLMIMRHGGNKQTESAVDKALEWLAKHQEADGRWSVRNTEGRGLQGSIDWDPGVTGLATLAFLGAGHSEKVGKYKDTVRRSVEWIISQQRADGAIGTDPKWAESHGGYAYHHAICGMALAEAAAMGRVPATKEAAQKAITYTCDHYQHGDQSDKLGFRYSPKAEVGDVSVSGWFIMQLKSAKVAGLQVNPACFEGASKFLDSRMADPKSIKKTDDVYDDGKHRYGYTSPGAMVNTTSIGILCRLYLGAKPEEVQGAARWLLQTNPPAWKADLGLANAGGWPMYYMYYTTLTMFQTGGEMWKEWNTGMKKVLCDNQRKDGVANGSWDPLSEWELNAGRAYTTALGAMCLEVYYRYMPLYR